MISRTTLLAATSIMLLAGCGSDGDGAAKPADAGAQPGPDTGAPSPDAGGLAPAAPTYWGHVAPIMHAKCAGCHQAGGIGPFALDSYEAARENGVRATAAATSGKMPPYYIVHDDSCGEFQDAAALTAVEKQTIANWVATGMAAGTPVALAPAPRPTLEGGKDFKTPMFAPVPLGTAIAQHDDYRCFLVDPAMPAAAFITGYDVLPGNPLLVHHVLTFVVDPDATGAQGKTNAVLMQELDARSPDVLGWECFGAAGEGVDIESSPVDWAPGQGIVAYPAGMGVPIGRNHKLVVQIHYNLVDPKVKGMMDSTTVRLRFADKVERQLAFLLPDPFLESLGQPMPDSLAAGKQSVKYTWKRSAAQMGLTAPLPYADLIAVMPHMHGRGRGLELRIGADPTAPLACAARTERWDFHWQKMYFYEKPIRLTPQSQLEVTCDFDTSQDREPVTPGWGTGNEMCLTVLMMALPPGI